MWSPRAEFPLRSLLVVPGINPEMIRKSRSVGADAIIFDLEDSVFEDVKPQARENVRNALEAIGDEGACTLVRVNAYSTLQWAKAKQTLEAFARAQNKSSGVGILNAQMVDKPVVAQAKRIIAAWQLNRQKEQE